MSGRVASNYDAESKRKTGLLLPFEPLAITFDDIRYSVDMPKVGLETCLSYLLETLKSGLKYY